MDLMEFIAAATSSDGDLVRCSSTDLETLVLPTSGIPPLNQLPSLCITPLLGNDVVAANIAVRGDNGGCVVHRDNDRTPQHDWSSLPTTSVIAVPSNASNYNTASTTLESLWQENNAKQSALLSSKLFSHSLASRLVHESDVPGPADDSSARLLSAPNQSRGAHLHSRIPIARTTSFAEGNIHPIDYYYDVVPEEPPSLHASGRFPSPYLHTELKQCSLFGDLIGICEDPHRSNCPSISTQVDANRGEVSQISSIEDLQAGNGRPPHNTTLLPILALIMEQVCVRGFLPSTAGATSDSVVFRGTNNKGIYGKTEGEVKVAAASNENSVTHLSVTDLALMGNVTAFLEDKDLQRSAERDSACIAVSGRLSYHKHEMIGTSRDNNHQPEETLFRDRDGGNKEVLLPAQCTSAAALHAVSSLIGNRNDDVFPVREKSPIAFQGNTGKTNLTAARGRVFSKSAAEKNRRGVIRKGLKRLQEVVPTGHKNIDIASLLGLTVNYVERLQLQVASLEHATQLQTAEKYIQGTIEDPGTFAYQMKSAGLLS